MELSISLLFLLVILGLVAATSVRVLREDERLVVFRLGQPIGVKGPGLALLIPSLDRAVKVSLRAASLEASSEVTTRDGRPVRVRALVSFRVTDPQAAAVRVTSRPMPGASR